MIVLKVALCLIYLFMKLNISATEDVVNNYTKLDNVPIEGTKNSKLVRKCEEKLCILKCCPPNEYIVRGKTCKKTSINNTKSDFSDLPLYDRYIYKTGKSLKDVFSVQTGAFQDKSFKKKTIDYGMLFGYNHYLTEEGILYEEIPNIWDRWSEMNNSQFCVEYLLTREGGGKQLEPRFWTRMLEPKMTADEQESTSKGVFLIAGFLVSSLFLVLVLGVYCALPELRNLVGLVLMAYVASLLGAFLLQLALRLKDGDDFTPCIVLTLLAYFCWMASFCWTNIMSLDIWWTFRGYAASRPIHRRGELFKFGVYCSYAWGVPFIMTVVMAALAFVDLKPVPWFIGPNLIDSKECFLSGEPKIIYLYTPMLILSVTNWLLFLMTVFNMRRLHRSTAVLDTEAAGDTAAHRKQRYRLMVYLKLSIIMGINWVLEVVSYFRPEDSLAHLGDIFNVLIGLSIFLIFVCKRQILAKLVKRYYGCTQPRRSQYNNRFSDTSYKTRLSDTSDSDISHDTPFQVCQDPKGPRRTLVGTEGSVNACRAGRPESV